MVSEDCSGSETCSACSGCSDEICQNCYYSFTMDNTICGTPVERGAYDGEVALVCCCGMSDFMFCTVDNKQSCKFFKRKEC